MKHAPRTKTIVRRSMNSTGIILSVLMIHHTSLRFIKRFKHFLAYETHQDGDTHKITRTDKCRNLFNCLNFSFKWAKQKTRKGNDQWSDLTLKSLSVIRLKTANSQTITIKLARPPLTHSFTLFEHILWTIGWKYLVSAHWNMKLLLCHTLTESFFL